MLPDCEEAEVKKGQDDEKNGWGYTFGRKEM